MDFWSTFYRESLDSPWMVGAEPSHVPQLHIPQATRLFVVPPGLPESAFEMMSKMIGALKLRADQVAIVEIDDHQLLLLQNHPDPKKIIFFGDDFPLSFGVMENWHGHVAIRTHGMDQLLEQADLKKTTWNHLKTFGQM